MKEFLKDINISFSKSGELLILSFLIYLVLSLIWRLIFRSRQQGNTFSFLKWLLFLLVFNLILGINNLKAIFQNKVALTLNLISLWMLLKHFLKGFYQNYYLPKIKNKNINFIYFDLIIISTFIIFFIIFLREVLNINLSSILTSSAIITGVVGLSMQDTIGSLISGLLIQIEKPFSIGEWIKVNNLEGRVVEINWRYTKIQTINFDYIFIPNNSISRDTLINYSRPISRIYRYIDVGINFSISPVRIKNTILEILTQIPEIAKNPLPRVLLIDYDNFRMIYRIGYYIDRFEKHRQVQDKILSSLWYAFKQKNISFPLPKQNLIFDRKKEKTYPLDSKIINILTSSTLFNNFSSQEIENLLLLSDQRTYPQNTFIFQQGDRSTELYFILKGKVEIKTDKKQTIAVLGQGDFFGEMALLTEEPRSADVLAVEDTLCLVIDKECFSTLLAHNFNFVQNIKKVFEERKIDLEKYKPKHQAKDTLWTIFSKIFK